MTIVGCSTSSPRQATALLKPHSGELGRELGVALGDERGDDVGNRYPPLALDAVAGLGLVIAGDDNQAVGQRDACELAVELLLGKLGRRRALLLLVL